MKKQESRVGVNEKLQQKPSRILLFNIKTLKKKKGLPGWGEGKGGKERKVRVRIREKIIIMTVKK